MTSWLLLIVTLGSAWMTWDAFRLGGSIGESTSRYLPDIMKRSMERLSLVEQEDLRRRSQIYVGIPGAGRAALTVFVDHRAAGDGNWKDVSGVIDRGELHFESSALLYCLRGAFAAVSSTGLAHSD